MLAKLIRGAGILAGGERDATRRLHAGERAEILRRPHRLLQKQRRVRPAGNRESNGIGGIHRTIHVHHQRHVGTDGLARGSNRVDCGLMQLDGGIALRQRLLAFARDLLRITDRQQARIGRNGGTPPGAEQIAQRLAFNLCREVPQRDIEPGHGEHRHTVATEQMQLLLKPIHESRNGGGIRYRLPNGARRDHLLDRGDDRVRTGIGEGIAPAGQSGVGDNFDQHDIERRRAFAGLREIRRTRVERNTDVVGNDSVDDHCGSLRLTGREPIERVNCLQANRSTVVLDLAASRLQRVRLRHGDDIVATVDKVDFAGDAGGQIRA